MAIGCRKDFALAESFVAICRRKAKVDDNLSRGMRNATSRFPWQQWMTYYPIS